MSAEPRLNNNNDAGTKPPLRDSDKDDFRLRTPVRDEFTVASLPGFVRVPKGKQETQATQQTEDCYKVEYSCVCVCVCKYINLITHEIGVLRMNVTNFNILFCITE